MAEKTFTEKFKELESWRILTFLVLLFVLGIALGMYWGYETAGVVLGDFYKEEINKIQEKKLLIYECDCSKNLEEYQQNQLKRMNLSMVKIS